MKMFSKKDITVVICNWMQTRMTLGAVRNFKKYYPDIPIIVVDSGSEMNEQEHFGRVYANCNIEAIFDNDLNKLREMSGNLDYKLIELEHNISHGSAVDYAAWKAETPILLTMDNDIRLLDNRLIDEYLEKMNENAKEIFAVGPRYNPFISKEPVVGLWFSLWQLKPIKKFHLTFSNIFIVQNAMSIHIEAGVLIHHSLKHKSEHNTMGVRWHPFVYPRETQMTDRFLHLKFAKDGSNKKELMKHMDI